MDSENIKIIFPVLAGMLGFAGGVFTFVNGRLLEAKTPEARDRVVILTLEVISFLFSTCGMLVAILFGTIISSIILFVIGFSVQIMLFLRRSGPVSRTETMTFCLLCCSTVLVISVGISFHFVNQNLSQIHELTTIVHQLIATVKASGTH